jgi:protein disulfide-isomerase A1
MLFLSFTDDRIESFKSQFYEAAKQYGANNISFLIGDITVAQGAFQVSFRNLLLCPVTSYNLLTRTPFLVQTLQYFGLKESGVPLIFIKAPDAKFIKPTVEPDQILPWLKNYTVRPTVLLEQFHLSTNSCVSILIVCASCYVLI